jgi:hypothetical protein
MNNERTIEKLSIATEALKAIREMAEAALRSDGEIFLSEVDIALIAEDALAKLEGV